MRITNSFYLILFSNFWYDVPYFGTTNNSQFTLCLFYVSTFFFVSVPLSKKHAQEDKRQTCNISELPHLYESEVCKRSIHIERPQPRKVVTSTNYPSCVNTEHMSFYATEMSVSHKALSCQ